MKLSHSEQKSTTYDHSQRRSRIQANKHIKPRGVSWTPATQPHMERSPNMMTPSYSQASKRPYRIGHNTFSPSGGSGSLLHWVSLGRKLLYSLESPPACPGHPQIPTRRLPPVSKNRSPHPQRSGGTTGSSSKPLPAATQRPL